MCCLLLVDGGLGLFGVFCDGWFLVSCYWWGSCVGVFGGGYWLFDWVVEVDVWILYGCFGEVDCGVYCCLYFGICLFGSDVVVWYYGLWCSDWLFGGIL